MEREEQPAEPTRSAAVSAWHPQDDVRLGPFRKLLLRLLRPFTERQDAVNAATSRDIERLAFEADRLQRRVQDIERSKNSARELSECARTMGVALDEPVGIGPGVLPGPGRTGAEAWIVTEGMRLRTFRSAMLRMLQPFAGRQNEVNDRRAESLEKSLVEFGLVRRRVQAIEHAGEAER